jgi:hypothetical protein
MFLISSDPLITSKSTQNVKKKNNKLCSEAMNLLSENLFIFPSMNNMFKVSEKLKKILFT